MNILLVGSGGREHALAWKMAQSPLLTRLVAAPGNPGIGALAERRQVAVDDVAGLTALAREIDADLVVIGPEAALAAGLADALERVGVPCFGPSEAAARIETSKAFAKRFADRHGLPTAAFEVFEDSVAAKRALDRFDAPYVIKADGLAAGKGVVVAATRAEAEAAIDDMLGGRFGQAGARVVIEEHMTGEEASLFYLCDGETAVLLGGAQDHKRAYDGDTGPNTGGMGAYSPAPALTPEVIETVRTHLVEPTLRGLKAEGAPFRGVLYAGIMLTPTGPRLVEYNARFGDPECQVLMLRMAGDLVPYLHACATTGLDRLPPPELDERAAICVVLAAAGYPEAPRRGTVIVGADEDLAADDMFIFHAGTARDGEGRLVADGGRVLNVCARGATLAEARSLAYAAVGEIDWPESFHRTDIGARGL